MASTKSPQNLESTLSSVSKAATHFDESLSKGASLKPKGEVTNIQFGRNIPTLDVLQTDETVPKPPDMTRQIPRMNKGTIIGLGDPMNVAAIKHNVQHVPRRKPVVVHGLNSLANAQAAVYTGTAEFFGDQSSVPGLRDSLNFDSHDNLKRDMLRVSKASATDEIEAKGGLHETFVRRTRTRKPVKQNYV